MLIHSSSNYGITVRNVATGTHTALHIGRGRPCRIVRADFVGPRRVAVVYDSRDHHPCSVPALVCGLFEVQSESFGWLGDTSMCPVPGLTEMIVACQITRVSGEAATYGALSTDYVVFFDCATREKFLSHACQY